LDALAAPPITERALQRQARWRRALFFGLTLLSAAAGGFLMFDILKADGLSALDLGGLVLFFGLFTWLAGAFWTAVAGFVIHLIGRDPAVIHADEVTWQTLHSRVAIIMPIYNEDVARVSAGIDAIWTSLSEQPDRDCFDFFILSDTRNEEIAAAEGAAWRALVNRHGTAGRMFYRRRSENSGRKAGNIADFVRRWGESYDYMVVLDADSVMTGQAMVTLARLMDAHPETGIIQSLPLPAGRDTLFARLIQFAARLNGPMLSSGLAFWQLGDANYWGHNAIIRVHAFAEHCELPRLPGGPPFGGEILSHDFVEAAFMRRSGYRIWMAPDVSGSWEEVPSNVLDFAVRDRRWTQGNLQHVRIMLSPGLHWLSRVHMLTGILSYVTSPMWLTVLVLSSIVTCVQAVMGYQYFQPGTYSLFPSWPQYRDGEIAALLSITIVLLILPKLMGTTLAFINRDLRRGFGGARKLIASLFIEQLFSMLLAPTMMLFHTTFVVSTLLGRPVSWDAQHRGDRGITYREALARHKWHVLLGLVWGATIILLAPRFIWWMLPVITGMLLSVPYTVYTSRAELGRRARLRGLLLTPEETAPPPELVAVAAAQPAIVLATLDPDREEAMGTVPSLVPSTPITSTHSTGEVPSYMRMKSSSDPRQAASA
jgi:membrane glycosyltransferase